MFRIGGWVLRVHLVLVLLKYTIADNPKLQNCEKIVAEGCLPDRCVESNSKQFTCTECKSGYWLKSGSNKLCAKCPEPCNECTHASTCTSCKSGYSLVGKTCAKDDEKDKDDDNNKDKDEDDDKDDDDKKDKDKQKDKDKDKPSSECGSGRCQQSSTNKSEPESSSTSNKTSTDSGNSSDSSCNSTKSSENCTCSDSAAPVSVGRSTALSPMLIFIIVVSVSVGVLLCLGIIHLVGVRRKRLIGVENTRSVGAESNDSNDAEGAQHRLGVTIRHSITPSVISVGFRTSELFFQINRRRLSLETDLHTNRDAKLPKSPNMKRTGSVILSGSTAAQMSMSAKREEIKLPVMFPHQKRGTELPPKPSTQMQSRGGADFRPGLKSRKVVVTLRPKLATSILNQNGQSQ